MKCIRHIFILNLFCVIVSGCASVQTPEFISSVKGKTLQYHQQNSQSRQDLSAAATDGNFIIAVDDGGKPSDYEYLRSMKLDLSNNKGFKLKRHHRDLEGATYQDGYYVVTSSLSYAEKNTESYYLTSRFKWDGEKVANETTVNLRSSLMNALKNNYPDSWFEQISQAKPKKGGLNIEGLSVSGENPEVLIFGLRSPLAGDVTVNPSYTTHMGKAILVKVKNLFDGVPSFQFLHIDLNGHGIRGMEYIPSLKGYIIISGPTYKAFDYKLWFLPLYVEEAIGLNLSGFDQLCRPETVLPVTEDDKEFILILSEESGNSCQTADFTYIKAGLKIKH